MQHTHLIVSESLKYFLLLLWENVRLFFSSRLTPVYLTDLRPDYMLSICHFKTNHSPRCERVNNEVWGELLTLNPWEPKQLLRLENDLQKHGAVTMFIGRITSFRPRTHTQTSNPFHSTHTHGHQILESHTKSPILPI